MALTTSCTAAEKVDEMQMEIFRQRAPQRGDMHLQGGQQICVFFIFTLCYVNSNSNSKFLLQGKIANGHGKLSIVSQNAARFAKKCNLMKVFGAKQHLENTTCLQLYFFLFSLSRRDLLFVCIQNCIGKKTPSP